MRVRTPSASRALVISTVACLGALGASTPAQTPPPRRPPDLYHWVLPVDRAGVDVALLHPNDCYRVQQAVGVARFGSVTPAMIDLQRQLGLPSSHLVDAADAHGECTLSSCRDVTALAESLDRAIRISVGNGTSRSRAALDRWVREVDHRPTPFDHWFGGAYTDVGSDDRSMFRKTPEQRMLFRHLSTSARGNCYEAKAPRSLSIHVRDQDATRVRVGVYRGYLYVEHHHPATVGHRAADAGGN